MLHGVKRNRIRYRLLRYNVMHCTRVPGITCSGSFGVYSEVGRFSADAVRESGAVSRDVAAGDGVDVEFER